LKFKLWSKGFCCWVSCEYNKDKATTISPHGYLMWRVNWSHLLNWTFEVCINNILLPSSLYDIRFNYVKVLLVSFTSNMNTFQLSKCIATMLKVIQIYTYQNWSSTSPTSLAHSQPTQFEITYPVWNGRNNHKCKTNKTKPTKRKHIKTCRMFWST